MSALDIEREKAEFEAEARRTPECCDFCYQRYGTGTYADGATDAAWLMWIAAKRASQPVPGGWDEITSETIESLARDLGMLDSHLHLQLFARAIAAHISGQGGEDTRLIPCAYRIGPVVPGALKIEEAGQIEGPPLWAVRQNGNCLNKQGEWEWEPMPSGRDDDFLARCRFATATEAFTAIAAKGRLVDTNRPAAG